MKGIQLRWLYNFDPGVVILNYSSKFAFKAIARKTMLNWLWLCGIFYSTQPQIDTLPLYRILSFPFFCSTQEIQKMLHFFIRKKISIFLDVLKWSTGYKKRIFPERSRLFHLFLLYAGWKPMIWDLSKNSSHNTLCQVVAVMGREKQSQNDLFYIVSRIQSNLTSLKPAFAPSLFILFTDFHKLFSCRKTKHQH